MKFRVVPSWKPLVIALITLSLAGVVFSFFYQKNLASSTPRSQLVITQTAIQPVQEAEITQSYRKWKNYYIITSESNTLRVRRSENNNDTVSEGIATGMLAAVSMQDKTTFDGLWRYAKTNLNNHGLMDWHVDARGKILDDTSATDADEDIAYALIAADLQWGGYKADATTLLQNMSLYDVESGTNVLKPGDSWGGSNVTSPAYFSPAYYPIFTLYTHDDTWNNVAKSNTAILASILQQTPAGTTGLIPDWTTSNGTEVTIYDDKDYFFGYRSIKAIWRLGLAVLWNQDPQAKIILAKTNNFFQKIPVSDILDGYTLDGTAIGTTHFSGFVDAVTIANIFSDTQTQQSAVNTNIHTSYYADSYHLLTLLLINNRIPQVVLKATSQK